MILGQVTGHVTTSSGMCDKEWKLVHTQYYVYYLWDSICVLNYEMTRFKEVTKLVSSGI